MEIGSSFRWRFGEEEALLWLRRSSRQNAVPRKGRTQFRSGRKDAVPGGERTQIKPRERTLFQEAGGRRSEGTLTDPDLEIADLRRYLQI